jgi:hypothetical protein
VDKIVNNKSSVSAFLYQRAIILRELLSRNKFSLFVRTENDKKDRNDLSHISEI